MNPDLAMGDELLKKTGAGNLFMVFGEPDVEIGSRRTGRSSPRSRGWMSTIQPLARFAARPPTTSPVGLSTPITTARVFLCATPTSPEPTSLTINSNGRYAQTSTKRPGQPLQHGESAIRQTRIEQDRHKGHQPLRRRDAEGIRCLTEARTKSATRVHRLFDRGNLLRL